MVNLCQQVTRYSCRPSLALRPRPLCAYARVVPDDKRSGRIRRSRGEMAGSRRHDVVLKQQTCAPSAEILDATVKFARERIVHTATPATLDFVRRSCEEWPHRLPRARQRRGAHAMPLYAVAGRVARHNAKCKQSSILPAQPQPCLSVGHGSLIVPGSRHGSMSCLSRVICLAQGMSPWTMFVVCATDWCRMALLILCISLHATGAFAPGRGER